MTDGKDEARRGGSDPEVAAPERMDASVADRRDAGNAQESLEDHPSAGAEARSKAVPRHAPEAKEGQGGGA